ncbi:DUF488 family protein [Aquidulcibacter sp.]|uniref:DUF488 domain-containing protein n=1 Tax=Aquidulcibacter sp. TaxID=2052990 RepID=UPI0025BAA659|nr:DUF488 domain-containing protein [Aquidulcibacter sp.]MCA3692449.1 DUF488 domain-containing protein [Aquidulcibacter sp.]
MSEIILNTIGFTQTSAESFFKRLATAEVRTVIDVRLNNTSQLAGFAKAKDLAFFLKRIGDIGYSHQPLLAPTQSILDAFKKNKGDWFVYERQFMNLMAERKIEHKIAPETLRSSCLLCSEAKPHHCHRRLVAEYLNGKWGSSLRIRHL